MNYIAPRKMTVVSLSGRSVEFEKGKPTYAPPQMHAELISFGIMPEEEMPEPEEDNGVKEPTVPKDREAALFAAFEKMALRNKREDFTGVGVPHLSPLSKELGWTVAAKERDTAWTKFQIEKSPV